MYQSEVNEMKYYDAILAGIPATMAAGAAIGVMTTLPLNMGVAAGGLFSASLMYHGMFRRAPV